VAVADWRFVGSFGTLVVVKTETGMFVVDSCAGSLSVLGFPGCGAFLLGPLLIEWPFLL
jgi:hypothetical protein